MYLPNCLIVLSSVQKLPTRGIIRLSPILALYSQRGHLQDLFPTNEFSLWVDTSKMNESEDLISELRWIHDGVLPFSPILFLRTISFALYRKSKSQLFNFRVGDVWTHYIWINDMCIELNMDFYFIVIFVSSHSDSWILKQQFYWTSAKLTIYTIILNFYTDIFITFRRTQHFHHSKIRSQIESDTRSEQCEGPKIRYASA